MPRRPPLPWLLALTLGCTRADPPGATPTPLAPAATSTLEAPTPPPMPLAPTATPTPAPPTPPGCGAPTALCVEEHRDADFEPVCPHQDGQRCTAPLLAFLEARAPGTDWAAAEQTAVARLILMHRAQHWQFEHGWRTDDAGRLVVPDFVTEPALRRLLAGETQPIDTAALAADITEGLGNAWGLQDLDGLRTVVRRSPGRRGASVSPVTGARAPHTEFQLRFEHPGLPPFDARLYLPDPAAGRCTIPLVQGTGHPAGGATVHDDAHDGVMLGAHFVTEGFATMSLGAQAFDSAQAETMTGLRLDAIGQSHFGVRALQLLVMGKYFRHLRTHDRPELCARLGYHGHSSGANNGNVLCRQIGGRAPGRYGAGDWGACVTDLTSAYLQLQPAADSPYQGFWVINETEPELYRHSWQIQDPRSNPPALPGVALALLEPPPPYGFYTKDYTVDAAEVRRVTDFFAATLR